MGRNRDFISSRDDADCSDSLLGETARSVKRETRTLRWRNQIWARLPRKDLVTKIIRRSKRLTTLVTAFACAASGLAAWAALDFLFPEPELSAPRYLVTKRPLARGLPLTFADLTFEHRDALTVCPTAVTDQELDLLKGAVLREDLPARSPVCSGQLDFSARLVTSSRIARGHRGFVFRPLNALPIQPGHSVDILVHPDREAELPYVAVSNAKILQVVKGAKGRPADLFVSVLADKIPLLEKAAERGKLSVALRNPDDREEGGKPVSRPKQSSRKKSFQTSVEIISEGE